MGIKERKSREKGQFKALVLQTAQEIIKEEGLEALSMRKIASRIEYSPSKLYQYFESKEKIVYGVCDALCRRLCNKLNDVPHYRDREKYLMALARSNMDFHIHEPESIEVLNAICFGPQKSEPPRSYIEAVSFYSKAVAELDYPSLRDEERIAEALDVIRVIFVGLTTIMQTETTERGTKRMIKLMENSLQTVLSGWKEAAIEDK